MKLLRQTGFTRAQRNGDFLARLFRQLLRNSLDFFGVQGILVDMKRALEKYIREDLDQKIILLTGPRQVGKTTLAKMLHQDQDYDYLDYDNPEHRLAVQERLWDRARDLVIFDELHKRKNWKSWLKGIYDTERRPPALLVIGSAKLDTNRKMGESLPGRFFQFRLHPLDLKEIRQVINPEDLSTALDRLIVFGGFPEPYMRGTLRFYNRWKKSHLDIILKQDLIDLENVQQLPAIETLIQLLRNRVGSPVSYSSLARDLQVSDKTVKRWLTILENMYVLFRVVPFHKNVTRAILKAPKFYFYDTAQVLGDNGTRLENLTACALLKELHYLADCYGTELDLSYIRTKDGREIDFLITHQGTPFCMIEVKWADNRPSDNFRVFEGYFPGITKIQLVKELAREKTYPDGLEIRAAQNWLATFSWSENAR
jgi:predicted AAA+ superfamily ATPase